jgi:hypothetical protein
MSELLTAARARELAYAHIEAQPGTVGKELAVTRMIAALLSHADALDAGATHPAPSAVAWLAARVGATVDAYHASEWQIKEGKIVLAAPDGVVVEYARDDVHVKYAVTLHCSPMVFSVSVVESAKP